MEFAQKFCNLYARNQYSFSSQGQRWINAVRKCLQVKLVPIIRPYVQTNCEEIKQQAFATHSPCYLAPYPGEPSICDLDCTIWLKVFWTIKGAFIDATIPSLKGMYDVTKECASAILEGVLKFAKDSAKCEMCLIMLTFKKIGGLFGKRPISDDPNETADSVAKQLSEQLHWKQNGVQWFSYITDTEEADDINVSIILGSVSMHDVNAVGAPEADMSKTIDDFAEAIGNEKLQISFSKDLNLTHFSACLDFGCQETYHEVTPKLKATTSGAAKVHGVIFLILKSILLNQLAKQFLS